MGKTKIMHEQAIIALLSHVSKQLTIVESNQDFILNLISQKFGFDLNEMHSDIDKIKTENIIQNASDLENIFDRIEDVNGYNRKIKFPLQNDESEPND